MTDGTTITFDRTTAFPPNPALQHVDFDNLMLDISIEQDDWLQAFPDLEEIEQHLETVIAETLRQGCRNTHADISAPIFMSIILTDDATVHTLNKEWRGKDKATNVLSFALCETETAESLSKQAPAPIQLGELIVALETVLREAKEQGKKPQDHFIHLCVHGCLHLVGFDHISDKEAAHMEGLETKILTDLGYPAPYETELFG